MKVQKKKKFEGYPSTFGLAPLVSSNKLLYPCKTFSSYLFYNKVKTKKHRDLLIEHEHQTLKADLNMKIKVKIDKIHKRCNFRLDLNQQIRHRSYNV